MPAADLAGLTALEVAGALTATQAKQVLAELVAGGGGDAAAIAKAKGFEAMDAAALEALVDDAIAVERRRRGRSTAAARTRPSARSSAR